MRTPLGACVPVKERRPCEASDVRLHRRDVAAPWMRPRSDHWSIKPINESKKNTPNGSSAFAEHNKTPLCIHVMMSHCGLIVHAENMLTFLRRRSWTAPDRCCPHSSAQATSERVNPPRCTSNLGSLLQIHITLLPLVIL